MNIYYCASKTLEKYKISEYKENTVDINMNCSRIVTTHDELINLIELGKQKTKDFLETFPKKSQKIKKKHLADDLKSGIIF